MTNWDILRAAGIGAYLMLFASVAWALVGTTSVVGKRVAKATAVTIHQFTSTVGLVLLVIHLVGVLVDRFVKFDLLDLFIPLRAPERTGAVAFGILAMFLMVLVLVSSWTRKHYSTTLWRRLHLLAVPAFTLALVHGLFSGTDAIQSWMWWTYASTGSIVLFLLIVRALTAGVPPRRARAPAAGEQASAVAAPTGAVTAVKRKARDPAVPSRRGLNREGSTVWASAFAFRERRRGRLGFSRTT